MQRIKLTRSEKDIQLQMMQRDGGKINEGEIEEAYVNKATLGERSGVISGNSSSEGLLASPNGPLSLVSFGNKQDATKVRT